MRNYKLISPGNNELVRTFADMGGIEKALDKKALEGKWEYATVYDATRKVQYRIVFEDGDWQTESRISL